MRPFPDPAILLHPQIPKPLHLLNPRTILGDSWWNGVRREAYWRHGFRCHACGIVGGKAAFRSGLEAHEMYDIDYVSGRVKFASVVALCYYCHNFIHRGRLERLLDKGDIGRDLYASVIQHGEHILTSAGLQVDANEQLVRLLRAVGKMCRWEDYHLVIDGVNYGKRFKSREEWERNWKDTS